MKFLESKGVKVETIRPTIANIKKKGLSPESYNLHIGDEQEQISIATPDKILFMHAQEIDPHNTGEVFEHLRSMRNNINWLI